MSPDVAGGSSRGGRSRQRVRGRQAAKRATFPFINSQIIAVADTGDLALTVSTIEAYIPEMNLVNVSTALHRLAKLTAGEPQAQLALRRHPAFAALLAAAHAALERARAGGASPHCQALSNITWALATVQHADPPLLEAVAQLSRGRVSVFKPFELSATLWAFAKLDAVDPLACQCATDLFCAAAEYIPAHAELFSFRCLVMTSWAFATARHHDGRLFHGIASRMLPMVPTANCQELANAAWAFGTAGARHERLLSEIARRALQQLGDFKPQELSNILWGFAAGGFFHDDLFVSAARSAQYLELQGQQLANVLWALSRLRPRHRTLQAAVLALLPRCTKTLSSFKPQEISSVALAAAKCFGCQGGGQLGQEAARATLPPQVCDFFAALPRTAPPASSFSGQSLANLAWSFSAVQLGCDTDLISRIAREAVCRAGELESSALLLLLRSLPTMRNDVCDSSVRTLFAEAARRVHALQPKELRALSRICLGLLGSRPSCEKGDLSVDELRRSCQVLTKAQRWTVAPLDEADCQDDALAEADGAQGVWNAAEPAAGQAAAEQPQGSRGFQAPPPDTGGGAPWPGHRSSTGAALALRVPYCVKNTFLHVEDENTPGNEDEEDPAMHLPPSLGIIPDSVSPEKLATYRADYQRFRAGKAVGAKGELCGGLAEEPPPPAAAEAEAEVEAEGEAAPADASPTSPLPPPLDFMPRYISLQKLEAYRLDYQKFRAGSTTGAKGEISSRVAPEEAGMPAFRLLPPLDIIPRDVSPRKLAAYRLDYQRFRAGMATGAKGEAGVATASDEPHFIALDKLLACPPERARRNLVDTTEAATGATSSTTPPQAAPRGPDPTAAAPTPCEGHSHGAGEAWAAASAQAATPGEAETDDGSRPELQVAFSVKNTFLHFEAACECSEGSSPEGQDSVHVAKLPPPLKIIPGDVCAEKLEAYRMDYHKFRAGNAVGAKGEVSSSVAES